MRASKPLTEDQPRWKQFEKIIAAIEKAMAPTAIVEHDVRLPSLSTGHPVQIDVLISSGTPPRQTRAMLEIQDRSRPVEVNEFRGWVQKKQDTGVEQLFVVSRHDFPQSVVDAVRKQLGPCVKLLTFKDVERGSWPFEFHLGEFSVMRHDVLPPTCSSSIYTEPELAVAHSSIRGQVFSREGVDDRFTLEELAEEALISESHPTFNTPGVHDLLVLIPTMPPLWFHQRGRAYRVKFFIASYRVKRVGAKMPLSVAQYKQVDYDGEPVWIAECEGRIEDKPIKVRLILAPNERGQFQSYTAQVEGLEQVFGRPERVHMLMAEWVEDEPSTTTDVIALGG